MARSAVGKDPVASASYFTEMMDFFFANVIGWDVNNNRCNDVGGEFGEAVAYAGGIETQGNGTLHGHYLIWIKEFPSLLVGDESSDEMKRIKEYASNHARTVLGVTVIISAGRPNSYQQQIK